MDSKRRIRRKRCKHCNSILDRIWFTALMTEEWYLDKDGSKECTARHSLVTDFGQPVRCPECDKVVGTGLDFGFGIGYK